MIRLILHILRGSFIFATLILVSATGQTATSPNLGSKLTIDKSTTPATYTCSWWGKLGCYYLLQTTGNLLSPWTPMAGTYHEGADAPMSFSWIPPDPSRLFVRVVQLDPASTTGTGDTNGNGLPDAWEEYFFGPLGGSPNGNPDGDSLTNLQEFLAGTDPQVVNPIAPTGLTAYLATSSSICLFWAHSPSAAGYKIYRNGVLIGTNAGPFTYFTDQGLSVNSSYSYSIRSYDNSGNPSAGAAGGPFATIGATSVALEVFAP